MISPIKDASGPSGDNTKSPIPPIESIGTNNDATMFAKGEESGKVPEKYIKYGNMMIGINVESAMTL